MVKAYFSNYMTNKSTENLIKRDFFCQCMWNSVKKLIQWKWKLPNFWIFLILRWEKRHVSHRHLGWNRIRRVVGNKISKLIDLNNEFSAWYTLLPVQNIARVSRRFTKTENIAGEFSFSSPKRMMVWIKFDIAHLQPSEREREREKVWIELLRVVHSMSMLV